MTAPSRTFCFSVLADADPSTLPRVLEVFAFQGLVPSRCHGQRSTDRLTIDLQLDGLDAARADKLARRLRGIVPVETVLCSEKAYALAV